MANKKNGPVMGVLFLIIFGVFITPYLSSCGKSGSTGNAAGSNTQLEVLNLSPDVHPINLYQGFIKQNTSVYSYPYPSGYFYLTTTDTPLQIRSASSVTANLYTIENPQFMANHKYTLFITGQYSTDTTISAILTQDDTTATPKVGFGKIRFINLSIPNTALNVTANDSTVFSNIGFEVPSIYKQIPVGSYAFQFIPTGTTGPLTTTLSTVTVQDGRLYTLYSFGIVGRTDTSAFNAGILTNR
jgi:hypothetical protein